MPTCPEAVILMLACVRVGAIHSVVFGGFGAQALADRISASGSKLVFTADVTYRRGAQVTPGRDDSGVRSTEAVGSTGDDVPERRASVCDVRPPQSIASKVLRSLREGSRIPLRCLR